MDRRMFLRGGAATLWLPFLPSAMPRSAWAAASAAPRRTLYWFMPNGFYPRYVTPLATGEGYDLPFALEGLAGIQDRVSVLSGLEFKDFVTYDECPHTDGMQFMMTDY